MDLGRYRNNSKKAENDLIEQGFIKTKVFGWITTNEADWLNKQLSLVGFGKTVEELNGVPSYKITSERVTKSGETVKDEHSKIYDFVPRFYEIRKARAANLRELTQ